MIRLDGLKVLYKSLGIVVTFYYRFNNGIDCPQPEWCQFINDHYSIVFTDLELRLVGIIRVYVGK